MAHARQLCWLFIPVLLLGAYASWQTKPISDWNDDDTHQVLNDSPWAKVVEAKLNRSANAYPARRSARIGEPGDLTLGYPGMGGMGRHGMRMPPPDSPESNTNNSPIKLTVRWESALPVEAAELKARNVDSPAIDERHYAIAVYGIPSSVINSDSKAVENQLKEQAAIKRDGKKDFKPSSVQVLPRDAGTVVVYFFSRSKEITRQDKQAEFEAQIGRLQLAATFEIDEMVYQGKLEL